MKYVRRNFINQGTVGLLNVRKSGWQFGIQFSLESNLIHTLLEESIQTAQGKVKVRVYFAVIEGGDISKQRNNK